MRYGREQWRRLRWSSGLLRRVISRRLDPSLWRVNRWDESAVQKKSRPWQFTWPRMNRAIPRAKPTSSMAALLSRGQTWRRENEIAASWFTGSGKAGRGWRNPRFVGNHSDLSGESLLPRSIEKWLNIAISLLPRVAGRPRIGPCVGDV